MIVRARTPEWRLAVTWRACYERDLPPTPKDAQIRIQSGGPTRHVCEVSCLGAGSGPRSRNGGNRHFSPLCCPSGLRSRMRMFSESEQGAGGDRATAASKLRSGRQNDRGGPSQVERHSKAPDVRVLRVHSQRMSRRVPRPPGLHVLPPVGGAPSHTRGRRQTSARSAGVGDLLRRISLRGRGQVATQGGAYSGQDCRRPRAPGLRGRGVDNRFVDGPEQRVDLN